MLLLCICILIPEDTDLVEVVQHLARKLITGMQNLSYDDRVKHLGLMRLNTRRLRSDLVETFKITNGNYSIDAEHFFEFDDGNRRGHSKKLFKRRSRLNLRKFVFGNRVIDH